MNKSAAWIIAYRKRSNKTLIEETGKPFYTIDNSWRYWRADPFIVDYRGHTYLFAEMYDKLKRKGVIGCSELTEKGAGKWRVILSLPYHLSYPHIIKADGEFFMIPESAAGKEIALYKSLVFPFKWEKDKHLMENYSAVDTTTFQAKGITWCVTQEYNNNHSYMKVYKLNENFSFNKDTLTVAIDDKTKRSAGNVFIWKGKIIRPAQDCARSYGSALNFYSISRLTSSEYKEELIRRIETSDINVENVYKFEGIHTYNFSEKYEVIDLKYYEYDWFYYILRPFLYIRRRIRRIVKGNNSIT